MRCSAVEPAAVARCNGVKVASKLNLHPNVQIIFSKPRFPDGP